MALKGNWILPGVACAALGFLILRSTCQDSRHAAALRFKNALIQQDLDILYEFVEPEEKEALHLSKSSFDWLMTEEFFKEWNFTKGQWNFEITKGDNGEHILCESLSNPKSDNSLGIQIVGIPGHFRCPAFVHFVLQATAMKRYGYDQSLSGGLGRMAPLLTLFNADREKLENAGILGDYDPGSHGIDTIREMQSRFSDRISKWRDAHPKQ